MYLDETIHARRNRIISYSQANLEYQTKINTFYSDRDVMLKTCLKLHTTY